MFSFRCLTGWQVRFACKGGFTKMKLEDERFSYL